jgi:hypothetical protein
VSLNKLTRRLRREIRSSPKKAAALGLLLLLAVYYWMPLLKGMIAKEDRAAETATESPEPGFAAVTATQAVPQPASAASSTPSYKWEDLVRWSQEDTATRSAETLVDRRDPFRPVQVEVAEVKSEPVEETPVQPLWTPERLGMKLSGTVVGADRGVAVIGGKAYAVGRSVELSQEGQVIDFKLTEVHSQHIVLERLGERFELEIDKGARN